MEGEVVKGDQGRQQKGQMGEMGNEGVGDEGEAGEAGRKKGAGVGQDKLMRPIGRCDGQVRVFFVILFCIM